jgi:ERCC4-type nuclease
MIIARIALRKILTASRRKVGVEHVLRGLNTFSKKMRKCIKDFFGSFRKNNYVDKDDQNTPYLMSVYKFGHKENKAIYQKLKSIYKNE